MKFRDFETCEGCIFLGTYKNKLPELWIRRSSGKKSLYKYYDIYFCKNEDNFILVYGKGSEYSTHILKDIEEKSKITGRGQEKIYLYVLKQYKRKLGIKNEKED